MSRWLLVALTVALAVAAPIASFDHDARRADSGASPPAPPSTVVVDNELLPARDLDECISALPQPDCGSEGRSGWRQLAIFGLLVVAVAFIAWRIIRSARTGRAERTTTNDT